MEFQVPYNARRSSDYFHLQNGFGPRNSLVIELCLLAHAAVALLYWQWHWNVHNFDFCTTNFILVSRTESEMLKSNKQYLQNSQTTIFGISVTSELEIPSITNLSKLGKCTNSDHFRRAREFAGSDYSSCLSVCFVRMEQLDSNWTDFHDTWYLSTFRQSVVKLQVSWKSDKNGGYFT